VTGFHGFDLE
jgi:hypothetical protein